MKDDSNKQARTAIDTYTSDIVMLNLSNQSGFSTLTIAPGQVRRYRLFESEGAYIQFIKKADFGQPKTDAIAVAQGSVTFDNVIEGLRAFRFSASMEQPVFVPCYQLFSIPDTGNVVSGLAAWYITKVGANFVGDTFYIAIMLVGKYRE